MAFGKKGKAGSITRKKYEERRARFRAYNVERSYKRNEELFESTGKQKYKNLSDRKEDELFVIRQETFKKEKELQDLREKAFGKREEIIEGRESSILGYFSVNSPNDGIADYVFKKRNKKREVIVDIFGDKHTFHINKQNAKLVRQQFLNWIERYFLNLFQIDDNAYWHVIPFFGESRIKSEDFTTYIFRMDEDRLSEYLGAKGKEEFRNLFERYRREFKQ